MKMPITHKGEITHFKTNSILKK